MKYFNEKIVSLTMLEDNVMKQPFLLILTVLFALALVGAYTTCDAQDKKTLSDDLKRAIRTGNIEQVTAFLKSGGDPSAKQTVGNSVTTALMYALSMEQPNVAKLLIENGADLSSDKKDQSKSPLGEAASFGYKDVVEMICNKAKNQEQMNLALFNATTNSKVEIVELLLKKGANPNAKNKNGATPLSTVEAKDRDLMEIYLNAGADINALDDNEKTLLMHASFRDDVELVKYLLSKGANPNVKGIRGMTAIDLANQAGNNEIVELFKKAPAKK